MRGKANANFNHLPASRITPAYAGKRALRFALHWSRRDHPRLCGEKDMYLSGDGARARITPAYAGKSVIIHSSVHHKQDHPRLCGEKSFSVELVSSGMGSPPPMRGKG